MFSFQFKLEAGGVLIEKIQATFQPLIFDFWGDKIQRNLKSHSQLMTNHGGHKKKDVLFNNMGVYIIFQFR